MVRDMGRVLEAVEQNYKTQESLWKVMNQNKNEISLITAELKVLASTVSHLDSTVSELKESNKLLTENLKLLQSEYVNNKRWIRGIVGLLATAVPLVFSQVHSKLEELKSVETRLNSVEWVIQRDSDEPISQLFKYVPDKGSD